MNPAWFGLVAVGLGLVALYWLKQKDVAEAAAALGLQPVSRGAQSKATSPEGIEFRETVMAEGTIEGLRAQLAGRITRALILKKARRNVTEFTVLALFPLTPPRVHLRLQPVGMLRDIEALAKDAPTVVATGDTTFDAAYRLYTSDAAGAVAVLTPDLRGRLLALRTSAQAAPAGTTADYLTSGLLLGTFDIGSDRATYYVYGSPVKKTAEQCRRAAPLLAALVRLC